MQHVVYLDEMQEPDALQVDDTGQLLDVTPLTEKMVHIEAGVPTRIAIVWAYCYYRIPIHSITWEPSFTSRDPEIPIPIVRDVQVITDPTTGKKIGISFEVETEVVDSWVCNAQILAKYRLKARESERVHRRIASFWVASQPPIKECLEALMAE